MKTARHITVHSKRIPIVAEDRALYGTEITTPEQAELVARTLLPMDEDREAFVVVLLNVRNAPIGVVVAALGGVDQCAVDVREVFRAAVISGCSNIIVAHNHPSGDTTPSREDLELTGRIKNSGKLLGINLLDHLIITESGSSSLAQIGLM